MANHAAGTSQMDFRRDWRLLKEYEGKMCLAFDGVVAVSHEDKRALQEAMHSAGEQSKHITVIPIAVDIDEIQTIPRDENANHILHIGTMYWQPNIDAVEWFIGQVFPLIKAEKPDVQFDVLGARPSQKLLAMNGNNSGIHVTGYVADPADFISKAGVMVVPLLAGGGMRVKILNALAQGLPIVTTSLGCEGIDVVPGVHLLVADEPSGFARQCCACSIIRLTRLSWGAMAGNSSKPNTIIARYVSHWMRFTIQ